MLYDGYSGGDHFEHGNSSSGIRVPRVEWARHREDIYVRLPNEGKSCAQTDENQNKYKRRNCLLSQLCPREMEK